ncbi:hypothetical protein VTO42DRAFT_7195 [Malbranchea cinnamomea]
MERLPTPDSIPDTPLTNQDLASTPPSRLKSRKQAYGLMERADAHKRCPTCRSDLYPCRNLPCNYHYDFNVPPTPMNPYLDARKIARLQKWIGQLKEQEEAETQAESIARLGAQQIEYQRRIDVLRGPYWKAGEHEKIPPDTPQIEDREDSGPFPWSAGQQRVLPSGTVKCLHCQAVCSSTQVDCPSCGGKVQGQCCHRHCNRALTVKHDPE